MYFVFFFMYVFLGGYILFVSWTKATFLLYKKKILDVATMVLRWRSICSYLLTYPKWMLLYISYSFSSITILLLILFIIWGQGKLKSICQSFVKKFNFIFFVTLLDKVDLMCSSIDYGFELEGSKIVLKLETQIWQVVLDCSLFWTYSKLT